MEASRRLEGWTVDRCCDKESPCCRGVPCFASPLQPSSALACLSPVAVLRGLRLSQVTSAITSSERSARTSVGAVAGSNTGGRPGPVRSRATPGAQNGHCSGRCRAALLALASDRSAVVTGFPTQRPRAGRSVETMLDRYTPTTSNRDQNTGCGASQANRSRSVCKELAFARWRLGVRCCVADSAATTSTAVPPLDSRDPRRRDRISRRGRAARDFELIEIEATLRSCRARQRTGDAAGSRRHTRAAVASTAPSTRSAAWFSSTCVPAAVAPRRAT